MRYLWILTLLFMGCDYASKEHTHEHTHPQECGFRGYLELWGSYYNIEETQYLDLSRRGLKGLIPPEIGCLTNLTHLDLSSNKLTGEISSWIGNLTNLTVLHLTNNQLTGEIPQEIGNLTNLTRLGLHHNQLTGRIPSEVCGLIERNNIDIDNIVWQSNLIHCSKDGERVREALD